MSDLIGCHRLIPGILILLWAVPSKGDIYSYTDPQGVVHFTNVPRQWKNGRRWKRVMKTGPGKASYPRGKKFDTIPPTDPSPDRSSRYNYHIHHAASLYQIPVSLIHAVIRTESDYDPRVVSRAGAMGIMQLMPSMAKGMGVLDPFNPRQNIFGGTRLLRILANRFAGDLVLTIAAYHAGSGAVRKYGGVPPYETTQRYLRMVLGRYYKLKSR